MTHLNTFRFLLFLTMLFCLSITQSFAVDYYWRGGAGNWSEIGHWFMSDGSPHQFVPDSGDDVYFDENSGFTSTSKLITINTDSRCQSIKFENCAVAPQLQFNANLYVYGSFQLQTGMEQIGHMNTRRFIYFMSTSTENEINTNGVQLYLNCTFNGSGEWSLKNHLTIESGASNPNYQRGIIVNAGKLILDNVQYTGYHMIVNNVATLSMQNTVVNTTRWEYNSTVLSSAASTIGSKINLSNTGNYWGPVGYNRPWFKTKSNSDQYNHVDVVGGWFPYTIYNGTFNKLSFTGANGILSATAAITTNELEIYAPGKYELAGNITIKEKLSILPGGLSGCGGFIELCSNNATPGAQRTVTFNGTATNVIAERVLLTDIAITGGTYNATGLDGGNNSGWNITSLEGTGTTRKWIGGAGNWNDPTHWSDGCIPTSFDNVVFDDASGFTAANQVVLVDMTAYAHDLSFTGTSNPPSVTLHFPMEVHGSLEFQTGMKIGRPEIWSPITAALIFRSNDPDETITMNKVTPYEMPFYFNSRLETGGWEFQDDLSFLTSNEYEQRVRYNAIFHQSGRLNFGGNNISAFRFYSGVDGLRFADDVYKNNSIYKNSRHLDISNANINLRNIGKTENEAGWILLGGQFLTTAETNNSHIIIKNTSNTFFQGRTEDEYNELECAGSGIGNEDYGIIKGGKHKKITIRSDHARISAFETGELLFASSGNYKMISTAPVKINEQLASTKSCGGAIMLYSDVSNTQRTIAMGDEGTVSLSNMSLTDIKITGDDAPYTITESVDIDNNTGWKFEEGTPTTFYWIGGNGNWSDANHWSTESGNSTLAGGCIPGLTDNVVFDDNSFSASGQTVTLDGTGFCNNMNWIGNENLKPVFNMDQFGIYISGSLELQKGMKINSTGVAQGNVSKAFVFTSSRMTETITSNGVVIPVHLRFEGSGGWKFKDALDQAKYGYLNLYFSNGHLDFNGQKVNLNGFSSVGGNSTRTLNIAGSEINISGDSGDWIYTGGMPLTESNSKNSVIKMPDGITNFNFRSKPGDIYYNLESERDGANIIDATFNKVYLKNNTTINNIVTDTLQFKPGHTYKFTIDKTSVIKKAWYGSGNNCFPTTICSTIKGTQAYVDVRIDAANYQEIDSEGNVLEDGIVYLDYINLSDINALAGADYAKPKKGPRSPNNNYQGQTGNNTNWILDDYLDKNDTKFKALGDDVTIHCENFPHTISTAGMVPTPESTFKWYKGSIAPSNYIGNADELVIASAGDAGKYYCIVDYDGSGSCELPAEVTITAPNAELLTWTGDAGDQDWNNYENWENENGDNATEKAVPARCISVVIPAGIGNYPDLVKSTYPSGITEIACDLITIYHGGEVLRTDLLDYYTRANVELNLPANQWHMLSAPLHNMYTGDVYVSDPAPLADGYFMEQMMFNASNPQTGVPASYTWTGRFNTADIEFQPGQGFALWIDKHGTEYTDHPATSMMFPKLDTYYNYFLYDGTVIGKTKNLDRSKNGHFIHEGNLSDDAALEMTLATSVNDATGENAPVLVGNPFMAHLNFKEFAARNSSLIENQFKLAYGISSDNGKMNTFVSCIWDQETSKYITTITGLDVDNPAIAPMQSFVVIPQTANPTIKASILETDLLPGDKLRSSSEVPAMLSVVAERAGESVKTLLLHRNYADNTYVPAEDSYTLFPESNLDPVFVYTRSNDGYALDINAFGNYSELIPLGIRTAKQGEITLSFDGMNSFDRTDIYLIDTYNNSRTNLSEVDSYTFNKGDGNLYLEDRFFLSFISRGTTGMDDMTSRISISNVGQELHILNPSGEAFEVAIYNTSGQCILRESGEGIKTVIPTNLNNGGVYVAKVVSEQDTVTKTIIIK